VGQIAPPSTEEGDMTSDFGRNRILRLLPLDEAEQLGRILEPVTLRFREPIYTNGKPVEHIYFPLSGMISVVMDMEGGQTVEAATIGREGMAGLSAFWGSPKSAWRVLSQIAGDALRAPADIFNQPIGQEGTTFNRLLRQYTVAFVAALAQSAACNRLHSLEQRMCRWLLTTSDRVGADEFPLTQDFLGQMLGVRRPSVSLAGAALQDAGLIKYTRGRIALVNRTGLEAASCECYGIVLRHHEDALDDRPEDVERRLIEARV
jgi:CRP-like cAMP-binding protein